MIHVPSLPEPDTFRDARAEAWNYALACLAENRREEKKAVPDRRPESAKGGSSDSSAKASIP